jgi:hypothetical protein
MADDDAPGLHTSLHAVDEALSARFAHLEAELVRLRHQIEEVGIKVADLIAALGGPVRFILSVTDENGDPLSNLTATPPQIADNDTGANVTLTFTDALNFPTSDATATVTFASSDSTVATIGTAVPGTITNAAGATIPVINGPITPVAPGSFTATATVTNSDGTTVTGQPITIEIIAGPAAGFALSVTGS